MRTHLIIELTFAQQSRQVAPTPTTAPTTQGEVAETSTSSSSGQNAAAGGAVTGIAVAGSVVGVAFIALGGYAFSRWRRATALERVNSASSSVAEMMSHNEPKPMVEETIGNMKTNV
mmetsp:Transcript_28563/g.53542  ORF Transcript_28563/g.53542 Transcript_28563/m.53542 type:complete len:117 (+) Transcript_28563:1184-1534(+)